MNEDATPPIPIRKIIFRFNLLDSFQVFKTVYLREFPDEYKKDFGDSKP